jgi:hypothetical protein
MQPVRGLFQPLDQASIIGWLWWGSLFLFTLILWIEGGYQLSIPVVTLLVITLGLGIIMFLRRTAYLTGDQLFLGQILSEDFRHITLSKTPYRLTKRTIRFQRGGRQHAFWLSKRLRFAIQQKVEQHDHN